METSVAPCVGFEVNIKDKVLRVTIVGARHLPAAEGYVFKARLFPGQTKHETPVAQESWPTYNATFEFETAPSNFLVLTGYSVDKRGSRRVLGAVTWRPGVDEAGSELWQPLQALGTGRSRTTGKPSPAERQHREMVVWLTCTDSLLSLGVARLKWNLAGTKELEAKKAQLYVKLEVFDGETRIGSHNSRHFAPGISVYMTADHDALLEVPLPEYINRNSLSCRASLCTKPHRLASRVVLGRVTLSNDDGGEGLSHLAEAFQQLGTMVNHWHPLVCPN